VEFREHNLAVPTPHLLSAFAPDVVFFRNVLMYFTPAVTRRVVSEVTGALASGGFLFLGHAETLRGLSQDYQLCHTHGTFYYQRREGMPLRSVAEQVDSIPALPDARVLPEAVESATSWFDAIQTATRRVAELAARAAAPERRAPESHDPAPAAPLGRRRELAGVFELVELERFDEALRTLEGLPATAREHPDALLLSAVLLTNRGRIAEAERACERLLEKDDLHAGAHYLAALCQEHRGDDRGAAKHDRMAMHLDPTFAMPHLHAGLLARRSGDAAVAERELGQALLLLEREDTSRIVLFGGGFSREALTSLCRSGLGRLGASG
jgi:chemotaxis protein methyltransferase CheR